MDKIGEIRRAYFEQRRPIKEIVRTLRVSRATVRKVIRGQETEFKYERGVQPAPKLGEWVEVLTEILEQEAKLPRRERRSTQRLFEELRGRGYDGAHDSVHRFVKAWRDERARVPAQAFVPMSFAPGEAYQFDWSHETITLQGLPLMIKAAHMKLSHSRMPFVRTYFRETQELVFDAHDKAFQFYGGICRRGIYDNMKTAVEAIFVGKARQYNRRFLQMCSHHLIEPVACTPAAGWEKGLDGIGSSFKTGTTGKKYLASLRSAASCRTETRAVVPGCTGARPRGWPAKTASVGLESAAPTCTTRTAAQ